MRLADDQDDGAEQRGGLHDGQVPGAGRPARLQQPMPWISKICSVKIVPASRVPKSMPKMVTTGTSAARRACL